MSAGAYLLSQGKRALRLLPQMLLLTLLLASVGLLMGKMYLQRSSEETVQQKMRLGVVADPDMPYLALFMEGIRNFDASRFALDFAFMDEAEAQERLRAKELTAYLVVPDDFIESLGSGEVHSVRYVTLSGVSGTTALLASEMAEAVGGLLSEAQDSLASAREYTAENLPGSDPAAVDEALSDLYTALMISREKLFEMEVLGVAASLSTESYFFCGVGTAFLMLWAISCSPFFSRRSDALCQLLKLRGVGPTRQVLCEYASFLFLMLAGVAFTGLAAALFLPLFGEAVPSLGRLVSADGLPVFLLELLMLCAMAFFLYELEPAAVGGILLQFFNAAAQGYVCGCFYPYSFFPRALQLVGSALPAGLALRALAALFAGETAQWLPAAGYTLAFLGASVLLRRRRLDR